MKVYVAIWEVDYEGFNWPTGVFSTREAALKALDKVEFKGDTKVIAELELDTITDGLSPRNYRLD